MRKKILCKLILAVGVYMFFCACGDNTGKEVTPNVGQPNKEAQGAKQEQQIGTENQQSTEGGAQEMTYEQISQDEAKELMNSEEGYIILDVRTQSEYANGHIPGAICVPNEGISDVMPPELPDLEQLILVYCRSGNRSKQAAKKLSEIGYTNIKEFGGINTWDGEIE